MVMADGNSDKLPEGISGCVLYFVSALSAVAVSLFVVLLMSLFSTSTRRATASCKSLNANRRWLALHLRLVITFALA